MDVTRAGASFTVQIAQQLSLSTATSFLRSIAVGTGQALTVSRLIGKTIAAVTGQLVTTAKGLFTTIVLNPLAQLIRFGRSLIPPYKLRAIVVPEGEVPLAAHIVEGIPLEASVDDPVIKLEGSETP